MKNTPVFPIVEREFEAVRGVTPVFMGMPMGYFFEVM
jgi:hypothetical protein